jgi:Ser/Thr protein kinase RdoA (MazF antagonist)
MPGIPDEVAGSLGIRPDQITVLKEHPGENGSWLAEAADGRPVVVRRYNALATRADLAYEHAVLAYLSEAGWVVPAPLSDLVGHDGLLYCLTRHVPGRAIRPEPLAQRRRRGRDLARLHLALRDLAGPGGRAGLAGQRPGWQAQHTGPTVHASLDWPGCVRALAEVSPRLASWADAAAASVHEELARLGAADLPLLVVHGDFTEWNVHYWRGRLAGVVDFALTHLDSRPYELAIARSYRAPEMIDAYREELAARGWPLSELEEVAIVPVYRAFRVDMTAWFMAVGQRTGHFDLATIELHLSRTGTGPP